jgi:hypothetical protein
MMRLISLLLLFVAGTAVARDRLPDATPTGTPQTCIPLQAIRETRVRSDSVIDFLRDRRHGWRVTLPARCPGLGFERRFGYATSLSQLCANDIITVLTTGGGPLQGASCGLAPFQPMTLASQ